MVSGLGPDQRRSTILMGDVVMDASVTLAWCFEDEATDGTEGILDSLQPEDQILVPAHWPTEVANGLLMALRKRRISWEQSTLLLNELAGLRVVVEVALSAEQVKAVLALAQRYGPTIYDAAYLELAQRRTLAIATLDMALAVAARAAGVKLLKVSEIESGREPEQ